MWPLTPSAFLALADGNATVTSRITAYTRAQGRLPDIEAWTDWKVDYDAQRQIYATGSAQFVDPSLWTGAWFDPLSPYGSELLPERGIVLVDDAGDERTEWIPMGRMVITDVDDALPLGTGAIEVTLADRSTYLADNPFDASTSTDPTETFAHAIERLARECGPLSDPVAVPFTDLSGSAGQALCPAADLGTDRLAAWHKLAKEINCEVFFTRTGGMLLRPIRLSTVGTPDWTIRDTDTFLSAKRTTSRGPVYSRVVVEQVVKSTGSTAPTPIRAVSVDNDPTSPTYHPRFGRSRTYRSALITSLAQAIVRAVIIRFLSLEAGQTVEVTHVPMEALDRGDLGEIVPDSAPDVGSPIALRQIVQGYSVGALVTAGPQVLHARGVEVPGDTDDSLAASAAQNSDTVTVTTSPTAKATATASSGVSAAPSVSGAALPTTGTGPIDRTGDALKFSQLQSDTLTTSQASVFIRGFDTTGRGPLHSVLAGDVEMAWLAVDAASLAGVGAPSGAGWALATDPAGNVARVVNAAGVAQQVWWRVATPTDQAAGAQYYYVSVGSGRQAVWQAVWASRDLVDASSPILAVAAASGSALPGSGQRRHPGVTVPALGKTALAVGATAVAMPVGTDPGPIPRPDDAVSPWGRLRNYSGVSVGFSGNSRLSQAVDARTVQADGSAFGPGGPASYQDLNIAAAARPWTGLTIVLRPRS